MKIFTKIFYAFATQLLLLHLKKNHLLLLLWAILIFTVTGSIGKVFGIHSLFVGPEYMGENSNWAYAIMGIAVGGFIMAFHISSYIIDGPRFAFLGTLSRPFFKFCINNGLIPVIFLAVHSWQIASFGLNYNEDPIATILIKLLSYWGGVLAMHLFLFGYFRLTNQDIFRIVAKKVDLKLKKARLTRVNVLQKLKERNQRYRVDWYWDEGFRPKSTEGAFQGVDKTAILKVFDQNHLNSVIIQAVILVVVFLIGFWRDRPEFQIPAAASSLLFFTFLLMIGGALIFWFRKWASLVFIILFLVANFLVKVGILSQPYLAYGLDYDVAPIPYELNELLEIHTTDKVEEDKQRVIRILEKWKANQQNEKPALVIVAASGGGLRSALWTMHVMQSIDSISNNLFYPRVQLMTGSSGGMLGLAYYRELKWQEHQGAITNANDRAFRSNIAKDLLNPIIFTLVINDFFFIRTKFEYRDKFYVKERGYAFERQLNTHTGGVFEKSIATYLQPELNAEIPMLILSPSVINDGRKLYISPQSITFMSDFHEGRMSAGMDFQSLFPNHQAGQLRFSTALRMNATFPIISPNVILPSEPKMEIMDSGLSDNFGMVDALEYLQNFQEWIDENTSGVILLSIRDTERVTEVSKQFQRSLLQKITVPFSVLANNWSTQQDFRNEELFKLVRRQFKVPIERIEFQYFKYDEVLLQALESEEYLARQMARASLSWHLTPKEKQSIYNNFFNDPRNRAELRRLQSLLEF